VTFKIGKSIELDTCASTQEEALKLLRQSKDLKSLYWVRANTQSQGRGRQGRVWLNSEDSLLCSVALEWPKDKELPAWISLMAGWALFESVSSLARIGQSELFLKWPNDLCVTKEEQNFKLAGVLCERKSNKLCIGWGLNIKGQPSHEKSISLDDILKSSVDKLILYSHLQENFHKLLEQILSDEDQGQNLIFHKICSVGMKHFWGKALLFNKSIEGTAQSLKPDGSLVIRNATGKLETISSGEVTL